MDTTTSFSIIVLAAMIHASFQLSVSMLLLLSGHSLGAKRSHRHTVHLVSHYLSGTLLMTVLLLASSIMILAHFFEYLTPPITWAVSAGLSFGLGIAVWMLYYRKKGTTLWLPRDLAAYLTKRTKSTKNAAEAFSLGLSSVIAEILFIGGPLLVASLALLDLPFDLQLVGLLTYVAIACLPLIIVAMLVGGGHRISQIQRWRESNKRFLQFAAGSALVVLAFYVYTSEVIVATSGAGL